ncbi:filamentous hemagglutinin N-terminal domain-containing protein [Pseudomonas sp. 770NI]|uniref:two-partner secretion domain-containing protein n=1 Tax=Pseudomonas sp. 770NI TaxID=2528664 RepID=UPI001022BF47|nr:filamentous hemagglutinin N-terminal domain-containing protein [Pseudomonas sp. 770NI]RZI23485.1 filamentous hemagglutinin N-terminal domain-containing protein [Pseudomonas sp. 770NI]
MDVRQFAFLARQPSAALKRRDAFFGLPKRGLALILANALFWQPLLAQAEGIVVSAPGTTVGAAGNGVPVVNIATPNGAGLSHNQFKDYNVGPNGVILNNGNSAMVNTQLGGIIVGNPNLKGGAANVILNEVNGGSPSQLRGYTEVAGQSAKVIVANPYGVTCSGCGFINTPNVTLTTGKPVLDASGQLQRYEVDGGAVTIDGQGLNASNVERFDIITRSAKINAQINARELNVIAGRNDVDAQSLKTTARADDGSTKPELAIDSSALGGMYAGAIKLVGTEAGVGVKLDGTLAASGGDIQLDANGRLSMAQAAATGNVKVTAQNVDLTDKVYANGNVQVTSAQALVNRKSIAAGQRIEINAASVNNPGIIEVGVAADNSRNTTGDLVVNAQTVTTSGNLLASRALAITAAQALTNQGAIIQAKSVEVSSAKLTNQGATARLFGEQSLAINSPAIVNLGGLIRFGEGQAATLNSASLDNRQGRIEMAGGSLVLTSADLNNSGGQVIANDLTVNAGNLNNQNGVLVAKTATVTASNFDNSLKGLIQADGGALNLAVSNTFNNNQGFAQASTDLNVTAGTLSSNAGGVLSADTGKLTLTAAQQLNNAQGRLQAGQGDIELHAANLDNQGGTIVGKQLLLDVAGGDIDNRAGRVLGDHLDVRASGLDNRNAGLLAGGAQGVSLLLKGPGQLLNAQGRIQSEGLLQLQGERLDNSAGILLGQTVDVTAQTFTNSKKGALISDGGDVVLKVSDLLTNVGGQIDAGERSVLVKQLTTLNNDGGTLRGKRLDIAAQHLNNDNGQLLAGAEGLSYSGQDVSNRKGLILSGGALTELNTTRLDNQGGTVQGDSLTVTANSVDNASGGLMASLVGNLQLTVEALANRGGKLFGKEQVTVSGATLDNSAGGQVSGNQINLTSRDTLSNQGGLIEANQGLTLTGGNLDNSASGQLRALGGASSKLNLSGALNNQNGTLEFGSQAFSLDAASLNNQNGMLQHAGTGLFHLNTASLAGSQGNIQGMGSADWAFGKVDGLGRVQLNDVLTYKSDQGLALKAGDRMASAKGLILNVASLDNGGELLSDGDISITTGDMSNSGRVSTLQTLTVAANNLSQNGGRLAATNARLTLGGTLDNLGFLTARQQLDIAAAQINNRGTLGAQGAVNLTAVNSITNAANTLLFSGGDMTLRSNGFSNSYGDVYSKGNLSFAARDGGRAVLFSNRSGTVESEGSIGINAGFIENAKDEFELGQTLTTGSLSWICGQHCGESDNWERGEITIYETYLEAATKDSVAARLVAGKNMLLQGDTVQNRYSLMAANGDLSITAGDLLNQGAATRTGQRKLVIGTPGHVSDDLFERMQYVDVPAFNAATAAGNFDKARFEELKSRSPNSLPFAYASDVTTWTNNSGPGYDATLQAGGTVNLNVARTLQNGTLHNNTLAQLTGTLGDDQTGIPVGGININLSKHVNDPSAQAPGSVLPVVGVAPGGGFVPVDYTGTAFAPVDPTTSPTFQLPKGEYGLFVKNADPTSHYLIETNPEFTSVSGFFSSDYMLGKLGFTADNAWRRLGDGQYETRLIRDAVLAQTGQRFLAGGLYSDADQFRYLMDNGLASKDALRLSLGVALTDQQVGALTHDIVWMENRVIDGQTVLVPVLYLAQADSRNVRGNSLIQGRDLNLVTGGDLINVGTLRASNNLSAISSGSIYTGGLVEAGNNLNLLAQDSIRNAMAGEIRGKQVSLTALKGDITNETTAIQVRDGAGMRTLTDTSAGTIVARENLAIDAGRDLTNRGALVAGNDANLTAGRDLNLIAASDTSVKHETRNGGEKSSITTDVKNLAASVTAGGNLNMQAGQDVNIIGSTATAGKDLNIAAGRDLNVASVSDMHNVEGKEKDGKKRIKTSDDQTTQVASVLTAGGDFVSQAGRDTTIVASRISAGNEAYLYSGDKLSLLAAQNSTYSLYDMKEKGGWGAKKTKRDEVTHVTNVGTEIKTGGDLSLVSGGDQLYQRAKLESGKDLAITSGGAVTFEAVKDLHQESHEKSKSDLAWTSAKGKGNTDETLRQSELKAQGELAIKAVNGLKIDIKQIDQNTVSQTIDVMVKADPQLAWLKEAEKRGDVDWRHVKELHDSFKYSHSSLGQGAMLAIIIVVTVLTAGAASALAASAGSAVGAGSTMAAATAATAATSTTAAVAGTAAGLGNVIATASLTSLASTGVVSTINNKGNLGAAFKETFSSDSLKQSLIAGASAGFVNYASGNWFGAQSDPVTNKVSGPSVVPHWNDPAAIGRFGTIQLAGGAVRGTLSEALGQGSFKDAMKGSLFDVMQATAFTGVGDFGNAFKLQDSDLSKTALHAVVGGLLSEAMGGDFKTGAMAAGANEALIVALDKSPLLSGNDPAEHDRLVNAASKLVGLLAAASVDGDVAMGSEIAGNAQSYNRKLHVQEEKRLAQEAKSLDATKGQSRSGFEWDALLTFVAGGEVDQKTNNELQGILAGYGPSNPEGQALGDDLTVARGVITKLQNEKVLLTWGDGSPIVANGDQVVAFKSTEKQYKDSLLFNPSSNTTYNNEPGGMGVVPDAWSEQYGERTAITKLPEIAALSSDAASQAEQIDRLRVLASGGINSDIDLKLLAELMPIGGVGKGALLSAIKELAARDALAVKGTEAIAGKAAETVAGKGIESAAGKGLDAAAGKGTEQFANQAQAKLAGYSPCCFAAGTMVATPDGERAIDALRVGDVVWTKPEEGGEPFASKVSATHIRTDQPIYQLTLVKNGSAGQGITETLQVTPGHPFYVPKRKGFVPLIELKPGDQLQSLGDGATQEASISVVSIKLLQSQGKTYNLTVDIGHTFYVGKLSTWVHNIGPCYTCNAGSCSIHEVPSAGSPVSESHTDRTFQELVPDGKVPSVRNGAFTRWFDDLSPAELDVLWENRATREAIEARIRQPGGLHEWCMVCRAPEFKQWGVPMSEIQRFRTKTSELTWVNPIDGVPGGHGGNASGAFHNELKAVIDNSKSLNEFNKGVTALRDRWKIDPSLLPELPRGRN